MTQRTKAALATQVSTLLADNTTGAISESDVRSVFTDTADSLVGGPASATDNALVRFDSTTGQLVQDSVVIVADTTGNMSGVGTLACGATTITGALIVTANSTIDGTVIFNNAAADKDFTVNKLTAGSALVYDAGADTLVTNATTFTHTGSLVVEGAVVINEASADVDTRIESNGNAAAFFVDAGNDRVGIFTAAPSVPFEVTGQTLITGAAAVTGALTSSTAKTDYSQFVGVNSIISASAGTWTITRSARGDYRYVHSTADDTAVLGIDITPDIRSAASKGFQLDSIDVIYHLTTNALDAHSLTLDKVSYITATSTTVTDVPLTGALGTATNAEVLVENLTVTTPAFNTLADSHYIAELTVDNNGTSVYSFCGLMLKFSRNDL